MIQIIVGYDQFDYSQYVKAAFRDNMPMAEQEMACIIPNGTLPDLYQIIEVTEDQISRQLITGPWGPFDVVDYEMLRRDLETFDRSLTSDGNARNEPQGSTG